MKKIISLLLSSLMILSLFAACGTAEENKTTKEKLSIVTTTFPQYDWVREILGEKSESANLTLLLDKGVDLHNYQPTVDDLVTLSDCDIFIYVGGESDTWVDDALKNTVNPDMIIINLLESLGDKAKEEEVKEGMQGEEEEETKDGEEEETEYDEHVWLSLKNANYLCEIICEKLCQSDKENEAVYKENYRAYAEKLVALDKDFEEAVNSASYKTVLFGDRFPFRYLVGDYGLDYYAAFSGCSAETEASFETVSFLADKVDELGLRVVLTIEGSDKKIAQTIIDTSKSSDAVILEMNSLQSASAKDIENGTTYLSVMENNLEVLKDAIR